MKSPVVKRSLVIAGHKTSVSLEDAFWESLKEIAVQRQKKLSELVAAIDSERQHDNLSSAIRLFVLDFYRSQLSESDVGHNGAHVMTADEARAPILDGAKHAAWLRLPPNAALSSWPTRKRSRRVRIGVGLSFATKLAIATAGRRITGGARH
jgi:predicted DNA-binding ribbon-helix-helix protein